MTETVNITIDTHSQYKALLAKGFDEQQAEGIISFFSEINIANAATKQDVQNLHNELTEGLNKMNLKIDQGLANQKIWFLGTAFVQLFAIAGFMLALIQYIGK